MILTQEGIPVFFRFGVALSGLAENAPYRYEQVSVFTVPLGGEKIVSDDILEYMRSGMSAFCGFLLPDSMLMEPLQIINNEHRLRFETKLGEEYGYIDYRWYKGNIALMHTFVPEEFRGNGVSSQLAEFALQFIRRKNLKMMVYCSFVANYLLEHPEYQDMVEQKPPR